MSAVGFDIGSENCCIAVVKSGGLEILDNEYSLRYTPTYVAFTEKSREIGISARNKAVINIDNTLFGFKRVIGKLDDFNFEKERNFLPLGITKISSGDVGVKVNYLDHSYIFSVEQVMAMILTKLKTITELKLNNRIRDCVIAVPIFFTDSQRRAMLDAANIAGLNPLKLVNEPTAIAFSYGFFRADLSDDNPVNVVFIDFGHTALTVSVFVYTKDKAKMIGCIWDNVGGRDFDNILVNYFVEDFKNRYKLDASTCPKARMSLSRECENLKKVMSSNSLVVHFQVECIMQGQDAHGSLKREVFEKLSQDVLSRVQSNFSRILVETQLKAEDIHTVEIVGGTSRIPAVKKLVKEVFGKEPNATLNQDEALARGCALQCALLSPMMRAKNFVVEDSPLYDIKLVWNNPDSQVVELVVFSFSDKLPALKLITLSMGKPFSVEAVYIDSDSKPQKIGTYAFGDVPPEVEASGFMRIKIKACLNHHGIFSLISARITRIKTEIEKKIETESDILETVTSLEDAPEDTFSSDIVQEGNSGFVLMSHELTIFADVPGLSQEKLNEYINVENNMIRKDGEEKEKANVRNSVEEYIYEARDKLKHEWKEFIQAADREILLNYLIETERWLYDNENLEMADYSETLKEIKDQMAPICRRYEASKERRAAVYEYSGVLEEIENSMSFLNNKVEYSSDILNDADNIHKMWQNSKNYLDEVVDTISSFQKHEDVPVSAEDLNKSQEKFQKEFSSAFTALQNKIENLYKAAESTGDGTPQNPNPADQDNKSDKTEINKMEVD